MRPFALARVLQLAERRSETLSRAVKFAHGVWLRAPYLHNGSVKTIQEAVRLMASVQLGKDLPPAEVENIAAFLTSLTGEFPKETLPRLPPTPGDLLK